MLIRDLVSFYICHKFANTNKDDFVELIASYDDKPINVVYPESEFEDSYTNLILCRLAMHGKTKGHNISFYDVKHFYSHRYEIKGTTLIDPDCYIYIIKEYQSVIDNIKKQIKEV